MSNWRDNAACINENPELFFPDVTSGHVLLWIEQAVRVCRSCQVTSECLKWALDNNQDDGIWGGMSEEERQRLRATGHRTISTPKPSPHKIMSVGQGSCIRA